MNVNDLYQSNACNISGKTNYKNRSRDMFFAQKKALAAEGKHVVLVDMINRPVEGAVRISNELFFDGQYPEGTTFCLYCHSGGSSGYVARELEAQLPQYQFINISGGIGAYMLRSL